MISELQLPPKRKATHSCKSRDTGKVILTFYKFLSISANLGRFLSILADFYQFV